MNTIWAIYRFSASCDFFVRVFYSTPKNKWEFADRLCFGGKYARIKKFVQNTEHQRLMCDGCFLAVQKAPYGHAIWPISGAEMHHITPQYGLNRTTKRALSERNMNLFWPRYRVYQKTALSEMPFITQNITFPHAYFPNLFCQKKVKKICKYVARVFFKNTDNDKWWNFREICSALAVMIYWLFCVNVLFREQIWCYAYTISRCQKFSGIIMVFYE